MDRRLDEACIDPDDAIARFDTPLSSSGLAAALAPIAFRCPNASIMHRLVASSGQAEHRYFTPVLVSYSHRLISAIPKARLLDVMDHCAAGAERVDPRRFVTSEVGSNVVRVTTDGEEISRHAP